MRKIRILDLCCQWFGVNMGFSEEDGILMENLYIFKGYGTKKVIKIKEFPNEGWGLWTEHTFEKAARNWHDSKMKRQH